MDQDTRNTLQQATQQVRRILEEEFAEQLEGTFDVLPSGKILPEPGKHLDARQRLTRQKLVDAIEHIKAGGKTSKEAVNEYIREAAFTFLNRFVALRMLESRGMLQECVSKGDASSGFKEFCGLAPGLSSLEDGGYRLYLECLFDELTVEVKVLFDRRDSASLLWPRRAALTELLQILGQTDLNGVWSKDETIGWVYQYFNSGEERKKMRDGSRVPSSSRELAVRNQFFTPRYVVEFLTDNTLGRIWHEMKKGDTRLVDECQYLVRRPMEFFLPDPDQCDLADKYTGREEMFAFWRSGDVSKLPGVPDTAVVVDWLNRIAPHQSTCFGFESCLKSLGETHDDVVERLLIDQPHTDVRRAEALLKEHPVILMHVLWRIGHEIVRGGYDDMRSPIAEHPEAGPLWEALRMQLVSPRDHLSQVDLLKQPVFVPHRTKKDPRDLKILDPACGSGHFLLYAFDLLIAIYEEAWHDPSSPKSEASEKRLQDDYVNLKDLHAAIPVLVMRHNLHGVDIDQRAAQIAAFAIWMRGQRAFEDRQITRSHRPLIEKSNIACAEPMPGEIDLREEFLAELNPTVLKELVGTVFEELQLADEAGCLLSIDATIDAAVRKVREQWEDTFTFARDKAGNTLMFTVAELRATEESHQPQIDFEMDSSVLSDSQFWSQLEDRIIGELRRYSDKACQTESLRRQLFREDASRGFAFVDTCCKHFDVVLMNPPFGECSINMEQPMRKKYGSLANDIYVLFVVAMLTQLNEGGCIGAITSRAFVTGRDQREFRPRILGEGNGLLTLFVDLGLDVLDGAAVETAMYTIAKSHTNAQSVGTFYDCRRVPREMLDSFQEVLKTAEPIPHRLEEFLSMRQASILYSASDAELAALRDAEPIDPAVARVTKGLDTGQHDRFLLLFWEVPFEELGKKWRFCAKGGDYSWFLTNINTVLNWNFDGRIIAEYTATVSSNVAQARRSSKYYFLPALTCTYRCTDFSLRALEAIAKPSDRW